MHQGSAPMFNVVRLDHAVLQFTVLSMWYAVIVMFIAGPLEAQLRLGFDCCFLVGVRLRRRGTSVRSTGPA